jgi:hypothetical protein
MTEWDVFISHNRKHKPWVRQAVKQWRDLGLSVFFDEENVRPGQDVVETIEAAVESSRHVILVVTPQSLESKWVAMEVVVAMYEQLARGHGRLVPVILEAVPPEKIRPVIRALSHIDLTEGETRRDRYHALLRQLGVVVPSVLPDPPAMDPTGGAPLVWGDIRLSFGEGATARRQDMQALVQLADKLWESFAKVADDSEMGQKLDEFLWSWRVRIDCLCKLFLVEDRNQSVPEQKHAIDYICINRGELRHFFEDEPEKTLRRLTDDRWAQPEVKQHAKTWLSRIERPRKRSRRTKIDGS